MTNIKKTTMEDDPNDACVMLFALKEGWQWNSMPAILPMTQHDDHMHPIGAMGFPDIDLVGQVADMLVDDEGGPLTQMGPPPKKIIGLAVVWEQFLRANGPGDGTPVGDHPDDFEARLCIMFRSDGGTVQGVHVRATDDIGEPVWGSESGDVLYPLGDEAMAALGRLLERLALLEPESAE